MTRVRRGWLCGFLLVIGMTTPALAQESPSYLDGAFRKLGRGIANIATCPAELLRMFTLVGRRDGYIAALTVGFTEGAWRTVWRGIGGAYEIATFYAPIPGAFKPVVTPEFVYAHGDWSE